MRARSNQRINGFKVAHDDLDAAWPNWRTDFKLRTCELPTAFGWSPRNGKWFDAMPRYFFNTRIGDELISDPEGEQLRDPDQAWEIARAMIRELLKLEGAEGSLLNATLEVTDDAGEIVLEFPFTEAILNVSGQAATRH